MKKIYTRIRARKAFTLIETLVAVSLLAIAIVAPMSLTTQALGTAYYARDQVTAFFLAQEAIEAVRSVRDKNILSTALGTPTDLMTGIPTSGNPFTVDTVNLTNGAPTLTTCSGTCPRLQTNGNLYGYQSGWSNTNFIREVRACYLQTDGSCSASPATDELRVSVTVIWQTAAFQQRSFTLRENLYRWVNGG